VDEARVPGDHVEVAEPGKVGDDVLGDAVGKVVLPRIATDVREREDRERELVGQDRRGTERDRDAAPILGRGMHRVDPNRTLDVLQGALTQVIETVRQLALHLVVDLAGDADAARLGQGLQTGCNVDAVAVDAAVLDDDVAEADTDPEPDSPCVGSLPLPLGRTRLDLDRAAYGVDDARELAQEAVAHQLDDPPAVLGQEGLDQLLPARLESLQGAGLVALHQPAVADHVGHQDGGEPPLDPRCRQGRPPAGRPAAEPPAAFVARGRSTRLPLHRRQPTISMSCLLDDSIRTGGPIASDR
jgi:hypothetical protein